MAMTEAEFLTQLKAACHYFYELLVQVGSQRATTNVVALTDAIKSAATGPQSAVLERAAVNARTKFNNLINPAEMRSVLDPILTGFLIDVLKLDSSRAVNPAENFPLIYRHFAEKSPTPDTFKSRAITFDTAATTLGIGDGLVYRLTVDAYGYPIENVPAPLNILLECIQDAGVSGVSPGEEIFLASGPTSVDGLEFILGKTRTVAQNLQGFNSDLILEDHSTFGATEATATPADLGAWEVDPSFVGTIADTFEITDTGYMESTEEFDGGLGKLALKVPAGFSGKYLAQPLDEIDLARPLFNAIYIKPDASEVGMEVQISLGSQNYTALQADGDIIPGVWNRVVFPATKACYPSVFSEGAGTKYKITVTNTLAYELDNVRLRPYQVWLGTGWAIEPGLTAFRSNQIWRKRFSFGDTATNAAIVQLIMVYAYGRYFAASGTPTIADPA